MPVVILFMTALRQGPKEDAANERSLKMLVPGILVESHHLLEQKIGQLSKRKVTLLNVNDPAAIPFPSMNLEKTNLKDTRKLTQHCKAVIL